jgi:hypothetical protein
MKMIIIGLPYFGKKLCSELKKFSEDKFIYLDIYNSKIDKLKYLFHLFSSKTIYSIGGTLSYNRLLNIALFFNKRIIMHWVGSDVLGAKESISKNNYQKKYLKAKHFSEVYWINNELEEIGLKSEIVPFANFNVNNVNMKLPDKFSILTYIGTTPGIEEFYGIRKIIKLAFDFPDIEIKIAGINKYSSEIPKNIKFLGWVKDMKSEFINSVLFLRLTEHDGLAFSVLEALSYARYVTYTYEFDYCYKIGSYTDLKKNVFDLYDRFKNKILLPNTEGKKFIELFYNQKRVIENLICKIKNY